MIDAQMHVYLNEVLAGGRRGSARPVGPRSARQVILDVRRRRRANHAVTPPVAAGRHDRSRRDHRGRRGLTRPPSPVGVASRPVPRSSRTGRTARTLSGWSSWSGSRSWSNSGRPWSAAASRVRGRRRRGGRRRQVRARAGRHPGQQWTRVARGLCDPLDTPRPLGPVRDVLADLGVQVGADPGPPAPLAERLLAPPAPSRPPSSSRTPSGSTRRRSRCCGSSRAASSRCPLVARPHLPRRRDRPGPRAPSAARRHRPARRRQHHRAQGAVHRRHPRAPGRHRDRRRRRCWR